MSEPKKWLSWGIEPIWWEGNDEARWQMPHQFWFNRCPHCQFDMLNDEYRFIVGFSNATIFKGDHEDGRRDGAATVKCPRCKKLSSIHIGEAMTGLVIEHEIEDNPNYLVWLEARADFTAMVTKRDSKTKG